MSDHNAFHVISNIQTDLYILRGISKLVLAMETAMEKGEDDPAVFFPGLFAIHCQLDDFEREIDKECQSYFECLQKDKATENQDELLSVLKEKPELVPTLLKLLKKTLRKHTRRADEKAQYPRPQKITASLVGLTRGVP